MNISLRLPGFCGCSASSSEDFAYYLQSATICHASSGFRVESPDEYGPPYFLTCQTMIVEGIVTSISSAGHLNVAPMGPIVESDFASLILRPFQPSTTFSNLVATRCGVFHVVDRVDIIARAAIGRLDQLPAMEPAQQVNGWVLRDCCRWFEFSVESIDATDTRSQMPSKIVHRGERRPFFGFNRARHAVLEAAILATRLHLLSRQHVLDMMDFLEPAVSKTGNAEENAAFEMLKDFILSHQETKT